jgi:hypothetical protein
VKAPRKRRNGHFIVAHDGSFHFCIFSVDSEPLTSNGSGSFAFTLSLLLPSSFLPLLFDHSFCPRIYCNVDPFNLASHMPADATPLVLMISLHCKPGGHWSACSSGPQLYKNRVRFHPHVPKLAVTGSFGSDHHCYLVTLVHQSKILWLLLAPAQHASSLTHCPCSLLGDMSSIFYRVQIVSDTLSFPRRTCYFHPGRHLIQRPRR